ncbi:hypothetical protein [Elioraea rosea]|uniref:hypothetical protein n=1 Tax=Elioraea rosea TaxID=2492390 RepID=UPI0013156665|nr:hypothetical protein [Elioraea rosea]
MAIADAPAWPAQGPAHAADATLESRDRLSWPTAIAVTATLSIVLWLGIAWAVNAALG